MRQVKIRKILAGAAFATAMVASPLAIQPASAIPANDSVCTYVPSPGGITSAQISWYPGQPGAQSALEVGCVLRNDTGQNFSSASFTVHDADIAMWHNGAAKEVAVSAQPACGATSITLSTANNRVAGIPNGNLNRVITGPGIPVRTFVRSFNTGTNVAVLNNAIVDSSAAAGCQGTPTSAVLKLENSNARSITDAAGTVGTSTLTSASANFDANDIGLSVSGTGIDPGVGMTTITAVGSATSVTISSVIQAPGMSPTVSLGANQVTATHRRVTGMSTNAAARIIATGPRGAFSTTTDLGLAVTGTCLVGGAVPANTVITGFTGSPPQAITTPAMPIGASGCDLIFGVPNGNAPSLEIPTHSTATTGFWVPHTTWNRDYDPDTVASLGVQLNLNPGFIAGSDLCTNDHVEGFEVIANWHNANDFNGTGATNEQPADTKAIGQLYFNTAAAKYSAFIIERNISSPGDPLDGSAHYDIVFPFLPTGIATCPSSATSPGLSFLLDVEAIAMSQSAMPTGHGRPGTGQVRSTQGTADGTYVSRVVVNSQGTPWTPQTSFERLCVYSYGGDNLANFQCGAG